MGQGFPLVTARCPRNGRRFLPATGRETRCVTWRLLSSWLGMVPRPRRHGSGTQEVRRRSSPAEAPLYLAATQPAGSNSRLGTPTQMFRRRRLRPQELPIPPKSSPFFHANPVGWIACGGCRRGPARCRPRSAVLTHHGAGAPPKASRLEPAAVAIDLSVRRAESRVHDGRLVRCGLSIWS